jgi:hypothetical protein
MAVSGFWVLGFGLTTPLDTPCHPSLYLTDVFHLALGSPGVGRRRQNSGGSEVKTKGKAAKKSATSKPKQDPRPEDPEAAKTFFSFNKSKV